MNMHVSVFVCGWVSSFGWAGARAESCWFFCLDGEKGIGTNKNFVLDAERKRVV